MLTSFTEGFQTFRSKVWGAWGWVARTPIDLLFHTAPKPLWISGLQGTLSDVGPEWGWSLGI